MSSDSRPKRGKGGSRPRSSDSSDRRSGNSRSGEKGGRARKKRPSGRGVSRTGGVERPPEDLPATEFEKFELPLALEQAISAAGYITPTPIQDQMIPLALDEKNVVGKSRTGTGKTVAFFVPLFALLDEFQDKEFIQAGMPRGPVRILVVVPTRELAVQVAAEAERLTRFVPVRTVCVYGGTRIHAQIKALETATVVVGTPGRILDHLSRRTMDLSKLDAIVLDEVDRMYDLGFRDDIDRILRASSAREQTLLMSATLNDDVERLIAKHVKSHERVEIESKTATVDEVEQMFYFVDGRRKQDLLVALFTAEKPERGIVFVRTRFSVDRLAHRLRQMGHDCHEIHSGLPQARRERILKNFREGKFPLLIATDVAGRGLHIDGITHIYNYDLPDHPEDYVHRVGRTARMGQKGHAVSLVTVDDGPALTEIEKLINKEIRQEQYPGFEVKNVHAPAEEKPKEKKPQEGIQNWTRPARRRR